MGFMSGGLGFASGMGSFIAGAAGKENQILDQQRQQGREDDLIWQSKFERGLSDYNKESEKRDQQAQMYNSLVKAARGDQRKASDAMLAVINGTKFADAYNSLQNDTTPADTAYQSDFLERNNRGVNNKYSNLDQIRGQLSPNAQRFSQMPQPPGPQVTDASGYAPQQAQGQPPTGQPQPLQPGQPQGQPQPGSGDQVVPSPGQQPPQAQAIPAASPGQPMGQPQQPTVFNLPGSQPRSTQPHVSLDPSHYANRGAAEAALLASGYTPEKAHAIAQGMQTAEEIQKNKLDQWKLEHPNMNRTLLQDKFVVSLQKRIDSVENSNELATDATNGIQQLVQGGVKTNATQPLFDMMNKVLASMGNDTLAQLGLANKVSDYNMMQKVITRMQFGQIPNYHLGRWTEREVGMLNNMINSGRTDENTNLKILLLIKSNAERTIRNTADLAEVSGDGSPDKASKGLALQAEQLKKLQGQENRLPWADVDPAHNPDAFNAAWAKAPPGSWFNDVTTGRLAQKPMQ